MIDSIDKIFDIKDIKWLPLELVNNVKIILTVSSDPESDSSIILKALQSKISSQNLLSLSSFTQAQWEDVLTFGGGATNGALQLPESWKKSDERAPIQAKVRFHKTQYNQQFLKYELPRFCGGLHGWGSAKWRT